LPLFQQPPHMLQQMFNENDVVAKEFWDHIHWYNNAFAFTLMGINWDHILGLGPYCFCVHGGLTHRCGVFLLKPQQQPIFTQLYIYDPYEAF
jgi:hypothetical protein